MSDPSVPMLPTFDPPTDAELLKLRAKYAAELQPQDDCGTCVAIDAPKGEGIAAYECPKCGLTACAKHHREVCGAIAHHNGRRCDGVMRPWQPARDAILRYALVAELAALRGLPPHSPTVTP